jgi:hypothetical protein
MSINLQELKDRLGRELMASGETFEADFVSAAKDVSSDLHRLGFAISGDDVDGLDELDLDYDTCYPAYRDGILYFLQRLGVYAKKAEVNYKATYDQSLAMAQCDKIQADDPETGVPARKA